MGALSRAGLGPLVFFSCALAGCAGGGGGGSSGGGGGGGGGSPSVPTFTIGAAARATIGSAPPATQFSSNGGPNFTDAGPHPTEGTVFPLTQTAVLLNASGLSADTSTNAGGATITDRGTSLELRVPLLGIDVTLNNGSSVSLPDGRTLDFAIGSGKYFFTGLWSASNSSSARLSQFLSGYQTPVSEIPSTGIATYDVADSVVGAVFKSTGSAATLEGSATLGVNFATRAITGTLHDITATDVSTHSTAPWNDVTVTANILGGSSTFSGTTTPASAPANGYTLGNTSSGYIDGSFYGPNAVELGGIWTLSDTTGTAFGGVGMATLSNLPACFLPNSSSPYPNAPHALNIAGYRFAQCRWWVTPSASIGVPTRATRGINPAPPQIAQPGGPAFDGNPSYPTASNPVTLFPVLETAVDFTATGLTAETTSAPGGTFSIEFVLNSIGIGMLNLPSAGIANFSVNTDSHLSGANTISGGNREINYTIWGLSYTGYGAWIQSNSGTLTNAGYFMFGYEAPTNAIPSTGTATYAGTNAVSGAVFVPQNDGGPIANVAGDASLTANFTTGTLTGSFTNMSVYKYYMPAAMPWNNVSVSASISTGAATFSGTTAVTSTPANTYSLKSTATGYIDGGFYGPNANEIGAVWTLSNGDGTGSAIGVVGARKQ